MNQLCVRNNGRCDKRYKDASLSPCMDCKHDCDCAELQHTYFAIDHLHNERKGSERGHIRVHEQAGMQPHDRYTYDRQQRWACNWSHSGSDLAHGLRVVNLQKIFRLPQVKRVRVLLSFDDSCFFCRAHLNKYATAEASIGLISSFTAFLQSLIVESWRLHINLLIKNKIK